MWNKYEWFAVHSGVSGGRVRDMDCGDGTPMRLLDDHTGVTVICGVRGSTGIELRQKDKGRPALAGCSFISFAFH